MRYSIWLGLLLLLACDPTSPTVPAADTEAADTIADIDGANHPEETAETGSDAADALSDLTAAETAEHDGADAEVVAEVQVGVDVDAALDVDVAAEPKDAAAEVETSGDVTVLVCTCGDGNCAAACGETLTTCSSDCKICGDKVCSPGEGPKDCKVDCCGACGDGVCKGYDCGEDPTTCFTDCGGACGNKVCDKGENPSNCKEDCAFKACGNGTCEPEDGGPSNCPSDCKQGCGNCVCDKGEDWTNCPVDCGYCGDGYCSGCKSAGETPITCGADCLGEECSANAPGACDDGNPCTTDSCTLNGLCLHAQNKLACEDGFACTTGDICADGACLPGSATLSCDDDNFCTTDSCDSGLGCKHGKLIGVGCDDGNACTQGDKCVGGQCVGGASLQCNDFSECTDDACDPISACVHTFNSAPCQDGSACSKNDACLNGKCTGGPPLNCDDLNPCTSDTCLPDQGCSHASNDGVCNDQNPCTTDSCIPGKGCINSAIVGACDDGNPCTASDTCIGGNCTPQKPFACDDGNPCTDDPCDGKTGACSHLSASGSCSDGDGCTYLDSCVDGVCLPGGPTDCDDNNPCTDDSCTPKTGQCHHLANAAPCSDDNACTLGELCAKGGCASKGVVSCEDADPCTADSCDKKTGLCTHSTTPACYKSACLSDGDCSIGQLCEITTHTCRDCLTTSDCAVSGQVCKGGSCVAGQKCGSSVACKAFGQVCNTATGYCVECLSHADCGSGFLCIGVTCMVRLDCNSDKDCPAVCDPNLAACVECASSADCLDGGQCGSDHACHAPVCKGVACKGGSSPDGSGAGGTRMVCTADGSGFALDSCTDGNVCSDDGCDNKASCIHLANSATCTDDDACTPVDKCVNMQCKPGDKTVCDDGNACTQDLCDGKGGCQYLALDANCDDGNACTDDACNTEKGCVHANNSAACDSKTCTWGDVCSGGSCVSSGIAGLSNGVIRGDDTGDAWGIRGIDQFGNGDLAIVSRYDSGTALWRVSPLNSIVWQYYNGDGNWHFEDIVVMADQSLMTAGNYSNQYGNFYLTQAGSFGSYNFDVGFYRAIASYGGSTFLAAGGAPFNGGFQAIVAHQSGGGVLTSATHSETGYDYALAMAVGSDDTYAIAGVSYPTAQAPFMDGLFVRFDQAGKVVGHGHYGDGDDDNFSGIVAAHDGGFIAVGVAHPLSGGLRQGWATHLSDDGSVVWNRYYGGSGDDDFAAIISEPTGGYYIVGGYTELGSEDGWLVKIDNWGNVMWDKKYGGVGTDYFLAIHPLQNGNLAIGGQWWEGTPYPQAWLMRSDAWGNTSCGSAGVCVGVGPGGCEDGNVCTADICNPLSGCGHVGLPDGATCASGKTCQGAVCK